MEITKVCNTCGVEKQLGEYYYCSNGGKYGVRTTCKACIKEYKNRVDVKERIANRVKERYNNDPEFKDRIKKHVAKYNKNNRDKINKRARVWYENNPDKAKKSNDEYRKNNPDKFKKYAEAYYKNNPDKVKKYLETYYKNNTDKVKKWRAKANRSAIENATDNYIKGIIITQSGRTLKRKDIPQELIELKRTNILLKRKIKNND